MFILGITTEEAEQMVRFTDNDRTKEEENIKEDEVLEDPFDRMDEWTTNYRKVMTTMMTDMKAVLLPFVMEFKNIREAILLMTKDDIGDDSIDNNNRSTLQGLDNVFGKFNSDTNSNSSKQLGSEKYIDETCDMDSTDITSASWTQRKIEKIDEIQIE